MRQDTCHSEIIQSIPLVFSQYEEEENVRQDDENF